MGTRLQARGEVTVSFLDVIRGASSLKAQFPPANSAVSQTTLNTTRQKELGQAGLQNSSALQELKIPILPLVVELATPDDTVAAAASLIINKLQDNAVLVDSSGVEIDASALSPGYDGYKRPFDIPTMPKFFRQHWVINVGDLELTEAFPVMHIAMRGHQSSAEVVSSAFSRALKYVFQEAMGEFYHGTAKVSGGTKKGMLTEALTNFLNETDSDTVIGLVFSMRDAKMITVDNAASINGMTSTNPGGTVPVNQLIAAATPATAQQAGLDTPATRFLAIYAFIMQQVQANMTAIREAAAAHLQAIAAGKPTINNKAMLDAFAIIAFLDARNDTPESVMSKNAEAQAAAINHVVKTGDAKKPSAVSSSTAKVPVSKLRPQSLSRLLTAIIKIVIATEPKVTKSAARRMSAYASFPDSARLDTFTDTIEGMRDALVEAFVDATNEVNGSDGTTFSMTTGYKPTAAELKECLAISQFDHLVGACLVLNSTLSAVKSVPLNRSGMFVASVLIGAQTGMLLASGTTYYANGGIDCPEAEEVVEELLACGEAITSGFRSRPALGALMGGQVNCWYSRGKSYEGANDDDSTVATNLFRLLDQTRTSLAERTLTRANMDANTVYVLEYLIPKVFNIEAAFVVVAEIVSEELLTVTDILEYVQAGPEEGSRVATAGISAVLSGLVVKHAAPGAFEYMPAGMSLEATMAHYLGQLIACKKTARWNHETFGERADHVRLSQEDRAAAATAWACRKFSADDSDLHAAKSLQNAADKSTIGILDKFMKSVKDKYGKIVEEAVESGMRTAVMISASLASQYH
jgi:hypothetical protein